VKRVGGFASFLGALLLPKCPLCIALMLSTLGLSTSAALAVAPLLRPAAMAFAAGTLLLFTWPKLRRFAGGVGGAKVRQRCSCAQR